MKKKYELTDETLEWGTHILHRIKALKEFAEVKKGDLGGWIEKEDNLSQLGDCWVYDDAKVFGNAKVYGNAVVFDDAEVYDYAEVWGNAQVYDNAKIFIYARIFANAIVCGSAQVYGNAEICGGAMIYDNAIISDARVYDNAKIHGFAGVSDNAEIYGEAEIYGNAYVFGNAEICANAEVKSNRDYVVFKNFWSSGYYFTWTRSNDMWATSYFYGTGGKLIEKGYMESEESGKNYEMYVNLVKKLNTPKESLIKRFIGLFKNK